MWLTNLFLNRPGMVVLFNYVFLITCAVISYTLGYHDYSPMSDRDFLIKELPISYAWDKYLVAKEYLQAGGENE